MSELAVGVRQLKTHLSEYLRLVKAGETIVITERGQPIGRLIPEAPGRKLTLEEKLQRLLESGLVEWNGQKPEFMEPVSLLRSDVSASDLVVELRE